MASPFFYCLLLLLRGWGWCSFGVGTADSPLWFVSAASFLGIGARMLLRGLSHGCGTGEFWHAVGHCGISAHGCATEWPVGPVVVPKLWENVGSGTRIWHRKDSAHGCATGVSVGPVVVRKLRENVGSGTRMCH